MSNLILDTIRKLDDAMLNHSLIVADIDPLGRHKEHHVKPVVTTTDCRTEEGVTVGVVDAINVTVRLLSIRDLSSREVQEALKDLCSDDALATVLAAAGKKLANL
jgi:hypothetical protein